MKKKFLKPKRRRKWSIKPATKVHSTRRGRRGYNRKAQRKIEKEGHYSESEQDLP